ncbi:MAG: ATP-grasp domain-containing protein [Muribaculaceae bacterium]|nr:ATP-grasp domain-containing protein [Muribaculaceae bacterium]
MKPNILITSVGKRVALVRAFKETLYRYFPNAKVLTTDMNPKMAPASYASDGCIKVPRVTSEDYIGILLEICITYKVGIIVPTIDTELAILSANKKIFENYGTHVCVSEYDFVMMCRDKRNTGSFFESVGIRIPKQIDKYNPQFPMFAKPYDGSLSADLHYIKKPEDLTADIIQNPKLIFMEYIDKTIYKEYTVDMYFGRDNYLKMAVPRERIEIRAGEINKGRTVKRFLEPFIHEHMSYVKGCEGCICGQFFYNGDSDIVGIEINPRFGGGYPLSYAAGANYPEFLIKEYLLGENLDYSSAWRDNLLMLRYDDAYYV